MNISIGIPVTRTKYLLQALQSIAEQTVPVHEVIVVDNLADGDVAAIAAQVSLPIRLTKRTHRLPPVENWNRLLAEVSGDWFILLSDDDFFAADHIEQLQEVSMRHCGASVLHTRVRLVDAQGSSLGLSPLAAEYESALDFLWHRAMGYRVQFLSDFAFRTDQLRACGGFCDLPSAWGTDDMAVFDVAKTGGIAFAVRPTLNYRIHPNSISSAYSARDKLVAIELLVQKFGLALAGGETLHEGPDASVLRRQACLVIPSYKRKMQVFVLNASPLFSGLRLFLESKGRSSEFRIDFLVIVRVLVRRFTLRK